MDLLTGPSSEAVARWLTEVETRMDAIQQQIDPLTRELETLNAQRALLRELLATLDLVHQEDAATGILARSSPTLARRESVRERVHREAVEVLGEIGEPIHINDLAAEYAKRGYKIPGQGKPANISVHLSGWKDIVSPERGLYALAGCADGEGRH